MASTSTDFERTQPTASPSSADDHIAQTSGLDLVVPLRGQSSVSQDLRVSTATATSSSQRISRFHVQDGNHRLPIVAPPNTRIPVTSRKGRSLYVLLDRITHKTAVLFHFPVVLALSASLIGISITRTRTSTWLLDDGFFTCSSAACLQLFSLYLLILPVLRRRALDIPKGWFVLSILLSFLCSVISVTVYPYSWQASGVLSFFANVAAAIATVQLVEGTDAGIKAHYGPLSSD